MEHDPILNDARKARRQQELGENAVCAFCGEPELSSLVRASQSVIDRHHVVGRAHDSELEIMLCRNCHAKETEALRDKGATMKPAATLLERLVAMFTALACFLES